MKLETIDKITKIIFNIIEIGYLFMMFVIMTMVIISDNVPIYVKLIICFIGVPGWFFIIKHFNKIHNF